MTGLLRSFLPLLNPIGFGAADFIEFAIALLLVGLVLIWRGWITERASRLAERTIWCMAVLAVLPVTLRLLLLPHYPVPTPAGSDDFSYLLAADTLRHLRLANPSHPMHRFFETSFVLQEPAYSSIFPLGQAIVLAFGRLLFGHPWAGVALSIGVFCALCYWMLRAWVPPVWALLGGLLAVIEFGPLNQWMNSYWGGGLSACAGCLVFGALPRLREYGRKRDAILLGVGMGLQALTRPYEALFLGLSAVVFLVAFWRGAGPRKLGEAALWAAIAIAPAIGLILLQNRAVTGSWATLPYQVSREQYGVPTTFTFQPSPVPHRQLTREQQTGYEAQAEMHGPGTDTPVVYFERLAKRVRSYRFFFLTPLYLALPFFLGYLCQRRFVWVAATLVLFALGTNFYPFFYSHYLAACACLYVLVSVLGLERLSRLRPRGQGAGERAAGLIVILCLAHFLFWYGVHLMGNERIAAALTQYETWDAINHGDPDGRIAVNAQLAESRGKQLVFVHYGPQHLFSEWVYNEADIDAAPVVWARDLGPDENEKLRRYYGDRTAWLLEPDAEPVKLSRLP